MTCVITLIHQARITHSMLKPFDLLNTRTKALVKNLLMSKF